MVAGANIRRIGAGGSVVSAHTKAMRASGREAMCCTTRRHLSEIKDRKRNPISGNQVKKAHARAMSCTRACSL